MWNGWSISSVVIVVRGAWGIHKPSSFLVFVSVSIIPGVFRSYLHYLAYPVLNVTRKGGSHGIQQTCDIQKFCNVLWGS